MGSQRVNFHSLTYCYELCLFIAVKAFCPEIDFENFVLFCFYLSFSFKPLRQLMRTNIFIPTGTYFVFSICHILLYVCVQSLIHVQCFAMPWTVACQIPLPMGFSRQEYWNELPFPPPGDLPNSGVESVSSVSPALAGAHWATWETHILSLLLYFPSYFWIRVECSLTSHSIHLKGMISYYVSLNAWHA